MSSTLDMLGDKSANARFCTTRWTVVLKAGADGPERAAALEQFCKAYWYPIYAFIRRDRRTHEDACDLAQGFFAKLLEKEWLRDVERRDSRFSTLLLTILKRYLVSEYRADSRLKRGGGVVNLSLDMAQAEEWFGMEPVDAETPEKTFARRWALAVMEAAVNVIRAESAKGGNAATFEALAPFLSREPKPGEYAEIEAQLGVGSVNVAVHRLRTRFREALREELGAGEIPAAEVDAELAALAEALR